MKTKVLTHEGVDVYKVETRGQTFYKSGLVFGEALTGRTADEARQKITAKHAAGDTRELVRTYEDVEIYQVREGERVYFISEPVMDEVITGRTIDEVAHQITVKHAMVGF